MSNRISVIIDVAADKANAALGNFRKSITDAEGATGKFKAGAGAAFDSVKANAGNLALAAGASLVAFGVKAVGAFQDTALGAGQLRDALGLSAKEASKYIETAGDLGISVNALEATIGRMNRTAADTPEAFSAIGAEMVRNADGSLNVNETFLSTVDALNKIPDASKRASAAQKIFGRSWMDIAEMVGQGADGLRESLDSVEAGKILGDDDIHDARAFRDSLDALKGVSEELSITVGSVLVPALTKAADATLGLKNAAGAVDDALGPVDNALVKVVKTSWEYLNPVGQAVNLLGRFKDSSDDVAEAVTEQSGSLVQASIDAALLEKKTADLAAEQEAAAESAEDQARALEQTQRSIRAAQDAVNDLMSAQLAAIDSNLGYRNAQADAAAAVLAYDEAANDAETSTTDLGTAARDAEGAVLAQAAAAVQLAEDQAAANGSALTAIEKNQLFKAELENLAGYTSGPLKAALEEYIATLGRIPDSKQTTIGFSGRGPTSSVNGYRASGGPVSAGGTYVVGEEGPELLQMGSSSGNVIPNGATVGGGATFNVTIMADPNPDVTVHKLREFVRKNGPIQGIT